eukprot:GILK01011753.1.p1 GENE.GILK01011753.1~~GILK01011753.1.p1  ORF type:complete len:415 (-),score=78.29 GILK01011753.1:200-1444(-)
MSCLRDYKGLQVTTTSPMAVQYINAFIQEVLQYGRHWKVILDAVEADPTCAYANCLAALYWMAYERPEKALVALNEAKAHRSGISRREEMFLDAVTQSSNNDIDAAIATHMQISIEYPLDLLNVKRGQVLCVLFGRKQEMLQLSQNSITAHPNDHFAWGMFAFALEETGQLTEAYAAVAKGERLLDDPKTTVCGEQHDNKHPRIHHTDPWLHHAMCHLLYREHKMEEALEYMLRHSHAWEHAGTFMYSHNWWHVALLYIAKDQHTQALDLYDHRIWVSNKSGTQEQLNAIGLLIRLDLRGESIMSRCLDVSLYAVDKTVWHKERLLDVLLAWLLQKCGHHTLVDELIQGIGSSGSAEGRFYAEAMRSFAREDYEQVVQLIQHRCDSTVLGGSDEQRDVIQEVFQCAIKQSRQRI